jgi:hypothetical protein
MIRCLRFTTMILRRAKSELAKFRAGAPPGGMIAVIELAASKYKVTIDDVLIVKPPPSSGQVPGRLSAYIGPKCHVARFFPFHLGRHALCTLCPSRYHG